MGSRPEPLQAQNSEAASGGRGPEWRALLGRADALAFGGRLHEALPLYQLASRQRQLRAEQLEKLVECLAQGVRLKEGLPAGSGAPQPRDWDGCRCRKCQGFLFEPVSLPCGHTFCKKCLEREDRAAAARCVLCRQEGGGRLPRVNVILSNLLGKWFPRQVRASQLRHEGNLLYREKKLHAALQKYDEALSLGNARGGRSRVPGRAAGGAPARSGTGSGERRLRKVAARGPAAPRPPRRRCVTAGRERGRRPRGSPAPSHAPRRGRAAGCLRKGGEGWGGRDGTGGLAARCSAVSAGGRSAARSLGRSPVPLLRAAAPRAAAECAQTRDSEGFAAPIRGRRGVPACCRRPPALPARVAPRPVPVYAICPELCNAPPPPFRWSCTKEVSVFHLLRSYFRAACFGFRYNLGGATRV